MQNESVNGDHFSKKLVKGEERFAGRWGWGRKEEVGVGLKSNRVERLKIKDIKRHD